MILKQFEEISVYSVYNVRLVYMLLMQFLLRDISYINSTFKGWSGYSAQTASLHFFLGLMLNLLM